MRIISKAAFAQEAGVSRSAITQAAKSSLQRAVVNGAIDADHPDARLYSSQIRFTGRPTKRPNDIAGFVLSNLRELDAISLESKPEHAQLIESVRKNLIYLGYAETWLTREEVEKRKEFVEKALREIKTCLENNN